MLCFTLCSRAISKYKLSTLDLLITRDEPLALNISVCDPALSDHFVVHCDISIAKPSFERKEIKFRKLKTIDTGKFCDELANSSLLLHPLDDLHQLVALYSSALVSTLNKHAPIKRRVITVRPAAPWYTEEIKTEKRKRRRLERQWCVTRSVSDRENFDGQCHSVNNMLSSSRLNYYSRLVTENQCDLRKLFSTFSKLLHQHPETRFPQHESTASLAHEFIAFSDNKIRRIRKTLIDLHLTMFLSSETLVLNVNLLPLQVSHRLNLRQLLDLCI